MSNFSEFTNLYSLSKTLRFELRPIGKTLENMKNRVYNGKPDYDPNFQTFLHDQDIEDAYQALKPIIDSIHEDFITLSLESEKAQEIDFSEYLVLFKEKKDDKGEKKLRDEIGKLYNIGEKMIKRKFDLGYKWNEKSSKVDDAYKLEWKVGGKEKKGAEVMKSPDILYAAARIATDIEEKQLQKHLKVLEGFFTYFSGFNKNRENYYETKSEKATAVATRIVNDNLPKFCDNCLLFNGYTVKRKNGELEEFNRYTEYLGAYQYLKENNKITQIKDAESNKMIEASPLELKYFDISYFNNCLSQKQIEDYNRVIGHYNLLLNLYNQAKLAEESDLPKAERKFKKLPRFKTLYKQIGCGKRDSLFLALKYDREIDIKEVDRKVVNGVLSVEKVLKLAEQAGKRYFVGKSDDNVTNTIPEFIDWLKENHGDWSGIYWSSKAVNTISNKFFANWHSVLEIIQENHKDYDNVATYDKQREQQVKLRDAVELKGLFEILDNSVEENNEDWHEDFFKKSVWEDESRLAIIKKSNTPSQALMELFYFDIEENVKRFNNESENILKLEDYKTDENKKQIKEWMDYGLAVNQMLKYFSVNENKCKGFSLNGDIVNIINTLINGGSEEVDWFGWYDALRNHLTKKPQDSAKENKLKLNFENSTLAGGWDLNKESDNYCVLLQDSELNRYLAVIAKRKVKGYNKIFVNNGKNDLYGIAQKNGWQKIEYKLLPGPNKMLPKCLLPKKNRWKYGATESVLKTYESGTFKKGSDDFSRESLAAIIDFYKQAIVRYDAWKCFDFKFDDTDKYEDIGRFYADVEKQGYKLDLVGINKSVLDKLVENGQVYLFQIANQDSNLGKKSDHKDNLHTMYWNLLFANLNNKPKLNGEAEIFYRKAISEKELGFAKNSRGEIIKTKKDENAIKNYRFSKEKFLFHVPITLNFCLKNQKINTIVQNKLSTQGSCFLGLDRGEKHLVYYSLVNAEGNEISEGSSNMPFTDKDGNPRPIKREKYFYNKTTDKWDKKEVDCWDYNDLLDAYASNRDMARKNWQTIGNIKNLKEGYISQVVHEVTKKVIEKPTFIVLEDLNTGFMRGRQKIEKSVYQKFETALAKKLNFIVDKNVPDGEIGSVTKAIQLTPPVQNYGDIENKKQVGIMLYTRANYTSQTDPLTGWRKTIYLKKGSEKTIHDEIREKFTDIGFENGDYFFSYTDRQGKPWKLWSGKNGKSLLRYRGKRGKDKNEWIVESFDLNKMLDEIFSEPEFDKSRSLYSQIYNEGKQIAKTDEGKTTWESLRFVIDVIQQIRNSGDVNKGQDENFLLSPVRDEKSGEHFDSRLKKEGLPKDADANGAFNIARKGIIMNEHIKAWQKNGCAKNGKGSDLDLFVSDEEWDLWLNHKEKWQDMLKIFSSKKEMEIYRKRSK